MTRKFYMIGDFNINVNSSDISNNSALFLNILSSNGVFSLTDKPTRLTSSLSTTID